MKQATVTTNDRASLLADRILQGAHALADFTEKLTEKEWQTPVAGDGRTVGVVVHHVASSYPVEIELARMLASKKPIVGVTEEGINKMNADHAVEYATAGKEVTLELLKLNGNLAAEAVSAFTDQDLENSATISLNADAPLTTQFFIEDHALRHSFHHLAKIKATLNK
jgi:hypothetical protein